MAEEKVNEAENANTEGEEGAEGEENKGGSKKKLIIMVLPLLLLGVGGGLYFSGVLGGGEKEETHIEGEAHGEEHGDAHNGDNHKEEDGEHKEDDTPKNAGFYALPDLIVNLSSNQGSRFLKLKVQLEIEDDSKLPEIEAITPRVIDQFQTYLREMRVEDLRGSAGIYRLRQELLYRVNIAAHPVKVTDVLFQEMLIQ